MWRILINLLALTGAVAAGNSAFGQSEREPYGPFDAVAEGARNSELRRLSLIDSQLDTIDARLVDRAHRAAARTVGPQRRGGFPLRASRHPRPAAARICRRAAVAGRRRSANLRT